MPHGQERTIQHEELLHQLGWVQRLARKLAGDSNVAADVTQDVWLKTHGRGMDSEGGLRRWLRALTRGLVRDSQREADRRGARERTVARPEAQPSASEVVERNALQQKVSSEVMALDEPYRSTVLYRYMDDLSTAEIATHMSVTEEAVRQRLVRARNILKARLDREFGGSSSAWALAILGAIPADKVVATSSAATATTAGSTAVIGIKVAAVGAALLGSVAAWRELAPSNDDGSVDEAKHAAVAYDMGESELASDDLAPRRRSLPLMDDGTRTPLTPLRELGLDDEPENEYVLAPLQMW